MDNDNVKEFTQPQGKQPKTAAQIRAAVEAELSEARLKEGRAKIRAIVVEVNAAKAVVAAKEAQLEAIFEEYSDVITL
jgi:hypothetical protein